MDDLETLNRRARLRELIQTAFDGQLVKLIDHIELRTGKKPNQGELSGLRKNHSPSKSFGDKKARTLTEQIGLNRRWFDMPPGTNLARADWEKDAQLLLSSDTNRMADLAQSSEAGEEKSERELVRRLRDIAETINDLGLMYLIGKAEEVAKIEPLAPRQTHSKAA